MKRTLVYRTLQGCLALAVATSFAPTVAAQCERASSSTGTRSIGSVDLAAVLRAAGRRSPSATRLAIANSYRPSSQALLYRAAANNQRQMLQYQRQAQQSWLAQQANSANQAQAAGSSDTTDKRAGVRERRRRTNAERALRLASQFEKRGLRERATVQYRRAAKILPESDLATEAEQAIVRLASRNE